MAPCSQPQEVVNILANFFRSVELPRTASSLLTEAEDLKLAKLNGAAVDELIQSLEEFSPSALELISNLEKLEGGASLAKDRSSTSSDYLQTSRPPTASTSAPTVSTVCTSSPSRAYDASIIIDNDLYLNDDDRGFSVRTVTDEEYRRELHSVSIHSDAFLGDAIRPEQSVRTTKERHNCYATVDTADELFIGGPYTDLTNIVPPNVRNHLTTSGSEKDKKDAPSLEYGETMVFGGLELSVEDAASQPDNSPVAAPSVNDAEDGVPDYGGLVGSPVRPTPPGPPSDDSPPRIVKGMRSSMPECPPNASASSSTSAIGMHTVSHFDDPERGMTSDVPHFGLQTYPQIVPPGNDSQSNAADKDDDSKPVLQNMRPALGARRKRGLKDIDGVNYTPSGDSFYPVEYDGVTYDALHLRVVYERDVVGFEDSKDFPLKPNSVISGRYQVIEFLGSAAFSKAIQCLDLVDNRMVCLKVIKNDKDFFDQSLDEIKLLNLLNANCDPDEKHILRIFDYFYHKEHLILVTELLRDNLYEFAKYCRETCAAPYFTLGHLQRVAYQICEALEYVHALRLIHCDLKPENILLKSCSKVEVKVIDFGSSCFVDDQLSSYCQSRSYRAPEVMLGLPYGQAIDIWSLGCILAEMWTGYVLFQNESVPTLLARISGIIGDFPNWMLRSGTYVSNYYTQNATLYQPGPDGLVHLLIPKRTSLRQRMRTDDAEFLDFLTQTLKLDQRERITAADALKHPFFSSYYSDGLASIR